MNEEELQAEIGNGRILLVDLRADWCPQCGPQENVLLRICDDYAGKVHFASVDVGLYPEVPARYGIIGLPALLLFKNGQLQEALTGFKGAPLVRLALARLIGGA
ncbi:MAG: thioredoxin family protein [Chloroflexi bacterium]|nr:thioredoxin family protein [Chloroflexota bacterium]MCI0727784.1 thioredoxin family protein [Chloroflexota bacterium]